MKSGLDSCFHQRCGDVSVITQSELGHSRACRCWAAPQLSSAPWQPDTTLLGGRSVDSEGPGSSLWPETTEDLPFWSCLTACPLLLVTSQSDCINFLSNHDLFSLRLVREIMTCQAISGPKKFKFEISITKLSGSNSNTVSIDIVYNTSVHSISSFHNLAYKNC